MTVPNAARRTRASLIAAGVAAILVLASCTAAPGASVSSSSPTDAPTASEPPAGLAFTWPEGDAPVVARELTGIDEQYINPGAVIDHDGVLHMYANVFTAWPGRVQVPHLTSIDGVTWTLAEPQPVLTSDDVPFAQPGADVSTGFVADDGTWVLILESVNLGAPWALGRATAPGPDGPWTVDPDPILEGGPEGSWDAGGLAWPSVVPTDDGFSMYFTGFDRPRGTGAIGLATSPDGVSWTKHGDPVLVAEADWELRKLDRPRVAATPQGLVMVYAGGRLTDRGIAWSEDGVTWRREGDAPAIAQGDFPVNASAWDAALIYRDGQLHYFLEIGTTGSAGTNVYRAVAPLP